MTAFAFIAGTIIVGVVTLLASLVYAVTAASNTEHRHPHYAADYNHD